MPVFWNLQPSNPLNQTIQDVNWYNKLPVWMAMQQVERMPYFSRWRKKYRPLSWKPNMGPLLQTVIAEPSPITRQINTPPDMTSVTPTTIVAHYERGNYAKLKLQNFSSFQFSYLPSQFDFRTDQVEFAKEDLMKQIAVAYDQFIRTQVLGWAPKVYIVGANGGGSAALIDVPYGETTDSVNYKDAAQLAAFGNLVGAADAGYMNFEQMTAVRALAENVIGMVPWNGAPGTPGENAVARGKFILTGEQLLYDNLSFDRWVLTNRPLAVNMTNSMFTGTISQNINFMQDCYPERFDETGARPDPEIEQALPALAYGGAQNYEVIPNPTYVNAPYGICYFEGNEPAQALEIGPPPKPFNQQSITQEKFVKMRWNGEVKMTDNILINYGSNQFDTNKYGNLVQLISQASMGLIMKTNRFVLPCIYRRNTTASIGSV